MRYTRLPLWVLVACVVAVLASARTSLAQSTDWQLAWDDEFSGTAIDTTKWTFTHAGTGFGNGEWEFYTDPAIKTVDPNAFVSDGVLHIKAIQESYGGMNYTSAKLSSTGPAGLSTTYGRIEIRAALPYGQGLWPAIWMMPTDNVYGGWSNSGEIDIMESHGQHTSNDWGTLHFGAPHNQTNHDPYTFTDPQHNTTDWHTYSIEWTPTEFRWYIDDILFEVQNGTTGPGGGAAWWINADKSTFPKPFDQDFYLILNLAVGGAWPGYPDATTPFPAEMLVDYVRLYKDPSLESVALQANPEPATLSLLVLGGAALLWRRRKK
jgi:beta-glucanase (GH16 family)